MKILTAAIEVFSSEFESTTLPTLQMFVQKGMNVPIHQQLVARGFFFESGKEGRQQGFYRRINGRNQDNKNVVAWGISRKRKILIVELVFGEHNNFWYVSREVEISELINLPGLSLRHMLLSMRNEAARQVLSLEERLVWSRQHLEFLDRAREMVDIAMTPPGDC